uniref:CSON000300 protein n=1 Tax=Culicoides sonorensis TaxID=179676 RepID=A0A336MJU2_CULSO
MLQIFKKSHRRTSSTISTEENVSNNSLNHIFTLEEAEKTYLEKIRESPLAQVNESRPKLSKYLSDILNERGCLCYFVQYLEAKNVLPLIKFWIDTESYRSAAELLCGRDGVLSNNSKNSEIDTAISLNDDQVIKRSVSSEGYDSLSFRSHSNESIDQLSGGDILSETKENDFFKPDEPRSNKNSMTNHKLQSSLVADAMRIYEKYLVTTSAYNVDVPATIQSTISLALCNKHEITPKLFIEAQKYIYHIFERDHLEGFLDSVFYCKYCLEVLCDESLRLIDLLYNESILFYFMEFLEQDHAQQYLEFWMTAVNFKQNLITNEYDKSQAQSDALILYEKYFSLQATHPLHLSDTVRSIVEGEICKDNEPIYNCFDVPLKIVEMYLEQNYFKSFLKSNLFQKYLIERNNRIEESNHKYTSNSITDKNPSNNKKSHKRTNSLPLHISKTNTLLASMDMTPHSNTTNNMQIDSQQLTDPDMLWQRTFNGKKGLSFGRINAFGRYQREFELNPINHDINHLTSASNRIKKAMRKLVNMPEDKVQEEIAWQVAEMIVKDVTNVTMMNLSEDRGSLNISNDT